MTTGTKRRSATTVRRPRTARTERGSEHRTEHRTAHRSGHPASKPRRRLRPRRFTLNEWLATFTFLGVMALLIAYA